MAGAEEGSPVAQLSWELSLTFTLQATHVTHVLATSACRLLCLSAGSTQNFCFLAFSISF